MQPFDFFNGQFLKRCEGKKTLLAWRNNYDNVNKTISVCSTPAASTHYIIFSAHAWRTKHFHVIESFWELRGRGRGVCTDADTLHSTPLQCFLFRDDTIAKIMHLCRLGERLVLFSTVARPTKSPSSLEPSVALTLISNDFMNSSQIKF